MNINPLYQAAEKVWGSSGVVEDAAKLILAKELLEQYQSGANKAGMTLAAAGMPIAAALGDAWGSMKTRAQQGKPNLKAILSADPCFIIQGNESAKIKLDFKQLLAAARALEEEHSKHPGNTKSKILDKSYWQGLPALPGQPPCGLHSRFGWCVHRAACPFDHPPDTAKAAELRASLAARERAGQVRFVGPEGPCGPEGDAAAPVRPGERECGHYMLHGYCNYQGRCRNNHPPFAADGSAVPSQGGAAGAAAPALNAEGLPLRPGVKVCPAWAKKGQCKQGAHCPLHHPADAAPGTSQQQQQPPKQAVGAAGTGKAGGDGRPGVQQPDGVEILDALVDAVWPPEGGKESYLRGALAKRLLSEQFQAADVGDASQEYSTPMSSAGAYLHSHWREQTLYNMHDKPFKSLGELLASDPYLTQRGTGGDSTVALAFGRMVRDSGEALLQRLFALVDAVWPPTMSWEDFLRGALAKRIISGQLGDAGAEAAAAVQALLAASGSGPSQFRINTPQAAEHLRREWHDSSHRWPSRRTEMPWKSFSTLFDKKDTTWFSQEAQPGNPANAQVVLDASRLLSEGPRALRRAARAPSAGPSRPERPAPAAPASPRPSGSGSGGGGGGGGAAAGPPGGPAAAAVAGGRAGGYGLGDQDEEGDVDGDEDVDADEDEEVLVEGLDPDYLGGPEEDSALIAAAEAEQTPPVMFWRSHDRSFQNRGLGWVEVAVRVILPARGGPRNRARQEHDLLLAELEQHISMVPVMAVACAAYAKHIHLMQLFLPHASQGGLEMAATVYLIDTIDPSRVGDTLPLIKRALQSTDCLKITHSCQNWMGLVRRGFGIELTNYFDTQRAHHLTTQLRSEVGKSTPQQVHGSSEVSLSALLRSNGLFHPVRHNPETDGGKRVWQQRPLTDDLITCAAADVVYLTPLAEFLVQALAAAASEARQYWARLGSKARLSRSSDLDIGLVAELAKGATQPDGLVAFERLSQWSSAGPLQVDPPPHLS